MVSRSLRQRLLLRLWAPLAGLLLAGAALAYAVALHFANVVHDRWLLDSAMSLTTQLRSDTGRLSLELPPSAVEMFEWDSVDRIYDEVVSATGRRLFGNARFPAPPSRLVRGEPVFYDTVLDGRPVRVVAIAVQSPLSADRSVTVQVAETKRKREVLAREIILSVFPLQTVILVVAGVLVWLAVTSGLATVDRLAAQLRRYEPNRLEPLRESDEVPSEIVPLVEALNGLMEKLKEAQGVQQRFVANAAHQLRTPLAALQVQTERAMREANPERHREALVQVRAAVARMRHLTQQLLALTRSAASSSDMLSMTDVDLARLAREELERWADRAVERGIDLGYSGPEQGTIVRGEPQLLRELIGNLVDNALRYGKAGGEVTLGVHESPPGFYVEDEGPGIPAQERGRVTDPFYRPPGSEGDGCGLGLAIASEIATRHGAALHIRDHVPMGTRVEVRFPAVA